MALQDLLDLSSSGTKRSKMGLSEARVQAVMPVIRKYTAFWREYPDLFVDFMVRGFRPEDPEDGTFHLYYYQRVFLRACMRHQYVYAVFPRGFSKSFLAILTLMVRCVLYPRAHLFVTSGGKEQAAQILQEKVELICQLIPAFKKEIDWSRGKTLVGKDKVKYVFKSGSVLDNLAARESSRGQRRHGGLVEECVGVEGTVLQEVIIPVMAIDRKPVCGGDSHPEETLNKSQIYITTAGYKNTFPYDKLISFLVRSAMQPDRCIVLGGTWRLPVKVGLQSRTFIRDQKEEGTFNEASFGREYESIWSGSTEDAFFNPELIDRNRILNQPEKEASGRASKNSYYVIAVDVGRLGGGKGNCDTVACIFNVRPRPQGGDLKKLVNIYTFTDMHFEDQCIALKKLYYRYAAKKIVIDGNGLGVGLVDFFVKSQVDPDTGDVLPDFGVDNDDRNEYKRYKTANTELDALFIIKANATINSECHINAQLQLNSNRVKLLIDERAAKEKLLNTERGKKMSPEERKEYLMPFMLTSVLKEEMLNLREESEGVNVKLKQASRGIKYDKFSRFEYGLYYIKQVEDNKKKRRTRNFAAWKFYN